MPSHDHYEVDLDRLNKIAESSAGAYKDADPFPHTMIDNFVKPGVLEAVLEECARGRASWHHMNDQDQNKFATSRTSEMGPQTRNLIQFLNGQEMLEFLESLTGISGLIPDPQLAGGGLHELRSGGFLRVHADFNYQRHLKLDRRINLLLYLNKDWDESYGGNLELWDKGTTRCVRKYAPAFNRDRSNACGLVERRDAEGGRVAFETSTGAGFRELSMKRAEFARIGERPRRKSCNIKRRAKARRAERISRSKRTGRRFAPPILTFLALLKYFLAMQECSSMLD